MTDLTKLPEFKKMSALRQRFLLAYIRTGNATVSALEAGYAKAGARQQGSRLLSDVVIKQLIKASGKAEVEKKYMDVEDIRIMLSDIASGKFEEATMGERIKALDQLAKTQGGYLSKLELSGEVKLTDLSDEEMKAELAQLKNAGVLDAD